jgi:DNA repair protein RecN (Recombination protein N)
LIKNLQIKNFILVDDLNIDFSNGLTALTGETGSGKSVIINALSAVLGQKINKKMIRIGENRAAVTASFSVPEHSEAAALLQELALDEKDEGGENECILRRVISENGRSSAYCNSMAIPVSTMKRLGTALTDIHAQHQNTRMLNPKYQRGILDAYGGYTETLNKIKELYQDWKTAQNSLDEMQQQLTDDGKIELIRYQIEEFENAEISLEEIETIEKDHKLLANSDTIQATCASIISVLGDDLSQLPKLLKNLSSSADTLPPDLPATRNLCSLLEQAEISLSEAQQEAECIAESMASDPEKLKYLDDRLSTLHNLARKHQVPISDLLVKYNSLCADLESLTDRGVQITLTEKKIKETRTRFRQTASKLTSARLKSAKTLSQSISASMRQLDMPHGSFKVNLDTYEDDTPKPNGLDQITFNVSTNPDLPLDNISKVVSGGELSRISLAIQANTARHAAVPTVIYDEVDSGIGGDTANTVGQNLLAISKYCQLICITHSPQVASICDYQILVTKELCGKRTVTRARMLSAAEREAEISRMLGAKSITTSSLAHAKELLNRAVQ